MTEYLVYMTGPIGGCSYEGATSWREQFTEMLADWNTKCLSPMRGKEYLSEETSIDSVEYNTALSSPKGVYTRDRWDSFRCDLMVANLLGTTKVSIGTMMEWAWADSKGTPIIMVMEEDNIHNHILVRGGPGFRVNTLEEAVELTKAILALENRDVVLHD
jgi:nucleoside 2-deoxyribosyltransferase